MPVVKIESNSGMAILLKMGVPATQLGALKTHQITVELGVKSLTFLSPKGTPMATATLPALVSSVLKGTLSMVDLQKCKMTVQASVESVISACNAGENIKQAVPVPQILAAQEESPNFVEATPYTDAVKQKAVKSKVPAGVLKTEAEVADAAGYKNTKPVILANAMGLYQPVTGTSDGSVYRVIAISKCGDHKIAARLKGGALSIRLETTNPGALSPVVSHLSEMGFSYKSGAHPYWSMHTNTGSNVGLMKRIVGSVLGGMPFPLKTAMPDMKELISE